MISATISIAGDETLRLDITNDGTGTKEAGNYDVIAYQCGKEWSRMRVENWLRGAGVTALVTFCIDALICAAEVQGKTAPGEDYMYGGKAPPDVSVAEAWNTARLMPPREATTPTESEAEDG